MIHFQLAGRLGNQLFIWAASYEKALSSGKKVELFYDRAHRGNKTRIAELDEFLTFIKSETQVRNKDFLGLLILLGEILEVRKPKIAYWYKKIIRLKSEAIPFSSAENSPPKTRLFSGYYQNPNSLDRVLPELLTLVSKYCENILTTSDLFKMNKVLQDKYQVMHIRRGDYVGGVFGILSYSYYENQIHKDLPLVICSDDSFVARELSNRFNTNFVFTPENSTAWECVAIMSNAKKMISSNSTLSWWGAAVADKNGSEVSIPEPWFVDETVPANNFKISQMKTVCAIFESNEV